MGTKGSFFLFVLFSSVIISLVTTFPLASAASAQSVTVAKSLITQPVNETQLTRLTGNTHPLARREFDLGTAPANIPMERMLLVLKRSPEQEAALRKLLDDQQDKNSRSYHQWLTPEQYGEQFGPTDSDLQTITTWLQSHGFQVGTTKGRTVLEFSGSASQVHEAFHTEIHKYLVNGEQHWANASDPSIPKALTPAVKGVLTLHNFIKKPAIHFTGTAVPAKIVRGEKPQVTFPPQNGQPAINALEPQDYAVIYNIKPVYAGITTGRGMTIGVVGRSNLFQDGQDVQNFFSEIGYANGVLGAWNIGIVVDGPDPGDLGGGEEAEATLDTTWSSAIAPGAQVDLVVSATTNTTDGVDLSETYIIENNLADVMTESFSACESNATDAQLAGASLLAEQAAAQGIIYIVSTGNNGAEGCDDPNSPPATHPISVNYLASTAFNVAVGGTIFNENGDPSKYWASTQPISETALSYIPEDVWNESSSTNGLWAGSGGASAGNIQDGVGTTGGVPKPSWQYGVEGIPNDGVRDLPDVALTAAGHDPYLLCLEGSCVPNGQGEIFVYLVSGTSASAPSFAGIMALIASANSDSVFSRMGLANYSLYRLAAMQSSYPSQCNGSNTNTPPASSCIFNDTTIGNNSVPGEAGYPNGLYSAGPGYDQATGLGSVNVANLVADWDSVTFNPTTTTLTLNNGQPVSITHGQAVPFHATVAPSSGTGTPTGDLVLMIGMGNAYLSWPSSMETFLLAGGKVVSSSSQLPGGSYNIWAHYAGDGTYAPSDSKLAGVSVSPEASTINETTLAYDRNGNSIPLTNVPFGDTVFVRADVTGKSGYGVPTGTVTFADTFGKLPGAIFKPVNNPAPLNSQGYTSIGAGIINFDDGSHTVTGTYNGDASFQASPVSNSEAFTVAPGFAGVFGPTDVTISSPGLSGTTTVGFLASTHFSTSISFACSGLPAETLCSAAPATGQGPNTVVTTNITVATTAPHTSMVQQNERRYYYAMFFGGLPLAGLFLVTLPGLRHSRAPLVMILLALGMVLPSCGGGGGGGGGLRDQGTPAGTYKVTMTATAGSLMQSGTFTLVVK